MSCCSAADDLPSSVAARLRCGEMTSEVAEHGEAEEPCPDGGERLDVARLAHREDGASREPPGLTTWALIVKLTMDRLPSVERSGGLQGHVAEVRDEGEPREQAGDALLRVRVAGQRDAGACRRGQRRVRRRGGGARRAQRVSQTSEGRTSDSSRSTVSQDVRLVSAWSTAACRASFWAASSGRPVTAGLVGAGTAADLRLDGREPLLAAGDLAVLDGVRSRPAAPPTASRHRRPRSPRAGIVRLLARRDRWGEDLRGARARPPSRVRWRRPGAHLGVRVEPGRRT